MFLLKMSWFRRSKPDAGKIKIRIKTDIGIEEKDSSVPDTIRPTTAPHNETELIINQLAALAATVSHTSTSIAQSNPKASKTEYRDEEETFHHLSSWITTSHLPPPSHTSKPSTSTLASKFGRRECQTHDKKRESSILNLNIGDLPALPFPRTGKGKGKPGPRYSPLPPPFVPKSFTMRPRVLL
ncbi:unnamed protein product [Penicillium salamii]|uniref:Uncharacterized protein n=1 Tax=Penicillium salamii TaxID=1612424 RepID=A0A9W4J3T4_9EURO|nr:unnamed protein product [Penicillium salamii]CAG8182520.1 unnamed protein product [Penicillium salamii]CAG8290466.1 unnamed protein product [Penicillium salamii]CAG8357828.1 unnamed protein product [Penicillium salamii]CAG8368111.1 unnamed protein product [Penicillium salamii]